MDQRAAQPELLTHAAGQFFGWAVDKGCKSGGVEQVANPPLPLGRRFSKQTTEKFDVFANAEIGIEVLAQTLGHIGDTPANRGTMPGIGHVAVEDANFTRVNTA